MPVTVLTARFAADLPRMVSGGGRLIIGAASGAPGGSSNSVMVSALIRLVLFAAIMIACLALLRVFAKKRGIRFGGRINVVESAIVGNGGNVAIVRVGSRNFLIGVGKESVTLLAELEGEEEVSVEQPPIRVVDYLRNLAPGAKKGSRDEKDE